MIAANLFHSSSSKKTKLVIRSIPYGPSSEDLLHQLSRISMAWLLTFSAFELKKWAASAIMKTCRS